MINPTVSKHFSEACEFNFDCPDRVIQRAMLDYINKTMSAVMADVSTSPKQGLPMPQAGGATLTGSDNSTGGVTAPGLHAVPRSNTNGVDHERSTP